METETANKKITTHIELPPSIKNSQNYLAGIVVVLIVTGVFYWFFVQPKMASRNLKNSQLSQLKKDYEELDYSVKKLEQLASDLKTHPQDVAKLDESLPLQSKSFRLKMLVQALADSAGVTLKDVNFIDKGDVVAAGNTELLAQPFNVKRSQQSITGSVAVSGDYNNLQVFVKKIESNSRIMDIQGMDISALDQGILNLRMDLHTYSYE